MHTITFHGFANGHAAFAEVMPDLDLSEIARLAKKRGKLASKSVQALYESGETGRIYAGTRVVAHFTISMLTHFLLPRP